MGFFIYIVSKPLAESLALTVNAAFVYFPAVVRVAPDMIGGVVSTVKLLVPVMLSLAPALEFIVHARLPKLTDTLYVPSYSPVIVNELPKPTLVPDEFLTVIDGVDIPVADILTVLEPM